MQSPASLPVHPAVPVSPERLAEFCRAYHIRRLALFGSALHRTMSQDSDIDLLVEFEADVPIGFFELIEAELALSKLLNHPVDLNTPGFLSEHFRDRVLEEALVLYEG